MIRAVRQNSSMLLERVPRSPDEEAALLRKRPDGWEYLLFAAILRRKMNRLEPKYRDHELGYVQPHGAVLDEVQAISLLEEAFHHAGVVTENVERVLDPQAQVLAFGPFGENGDPARIEHLAERLIDIYESWLDWAGSLRGAAVPERFERAFRLANSFVDAPIEQMRDFVNRTVEECDRIPALLREEEPVRMTLDLTITIGEGVESALAQEIDRLAA